MAAKTQQRPLPLFGRMDSNWPQNNNDNNNPKNQIAKNLDNIENKPSAAKPKVTKPSPVPKVPTVQQSADVQGTQAVPQTPQAPQVSAQKFESVDTALSSTDAAAASPTTSVGDPTFGQQSDPPQVTNLDLPTPAEIITQETEIPTFLPEPIPEAVQSVGGEGNDSGSYPSSPNYALPIGISAAVATIILFCFLYFILRRKRIAANLAAKERYEAMMAITVQPITPRTAPPLTLSMETLTRPMDLRFNV